MKLKEFLKQFEGLDSESLILFKEPKGYKNRNKKLALKPSDEKIVIKEIFISSLAKRIYYGETSDDYNKIKAVLIPQFDLSDL